MRVTQQSRRQVRIQNAVFLVLFVGVIGLLAWLTQEFSFQADWTAGNRNTLSETTQRLLEGTEGPLAITAFVVQDDELRRDIKERVKRYQRYRPDLTLDFVNPDLDPGRAREAGITRSGQLLLSLGERNERLDFAVMNEQALANALQRLARAGERWIAVLEGHEERDPSETGNQGWSQLADTLRRSGFKIQPLNLIRTPQIPDNTAMLVVASPQRELLPGEVAAIQSYVRAGGNLLWLQDPGAGLHGLRPLADELGVRFIRGVIVDANPELRLLLGIQHPAVIPVVDYRVHPVTRELGVQTLFPYAGAVEHQGTPDWRVEPFLVSLPQTWSEVAELSGEIVFEPESGDRRGPLNIGLSLTRDLPAAGAGEGDEPPSGARQQRIVVVGDSDFLANAYLGNGGNLELATNMFNWLSQDDSLIAITPKTAPDTRLELGDVSTIVIGLGFLILLPLLLVGSGITIWLRRRRL
jgi:ABC-type uncharacterized transport system involved in gliding motility auxiliary subunit